MKPLNLSNSIYQRNGSKMGLDVKDGMLINNMPQEMMGIQKIAKVVKEMRKAEKIETMSKAYMLGEMKSDMGECDMC